MNIAIVGTGYVGLVTGTCLERDFDGSDEVFGAKIGEEGVKIKFEVKRKE